MLVSLPPDHSVAELSVGCPLHCNQRPIVAELFDLAIEFGSPRYQTLLVRRELAHADLLSLLRENSRRGSTMRTCGSISATVESPQSGSLLTATSANGVNDEAISEKS